MNYSKDIKELSSILKCFYKSASESKKGYEYVIDKLTSTTNDNYLNLRGENIRSHKFDNKEVNQIYISYCKKADCKHCVISKYCNYNINLLINGINNNAPKIVDLFCGAGGLSLGFTQCGFITSLANDIEPCCVDTYAHNHPDTPRKHIVLGDINHVIKDIDSLLRFKNVDVVIGGPPCQGFSMANRQRIIDDPRNVLYKSYVKVVELVKPSFFVMENVKGMLSVADQVVEDFNKIGYSVSYKVLNAKDYGVPQNRERLIYIGNKNNIDNDRIFEEILDKRASIDEYYLKDALYGLRSLNALTIRNATEHEDEKSGHIIERNTNNNTNSYLSLINQGEVYPLVFNHKARYNNDRDIEIYKRLNQGDRSDDPKIADIMPYASRNDIFKDKYFKLEENKFCKTITAHMKFDCNMYIHPTQARGLTPREAARVQSYPDNYFFRGPYTKTYMQIGNSVPPLLGRAIASILKKYL